VDFCLFHYFEMPVKPVLLKDIKRTAVQSHQLQVGSGSYNRYSPLVSRERTFSYGKRQLPSDASAETASKSPRLDRKIIFDQVRVHESAIRELKKMVTASSGKVDLPEGTPDVWKAISMIVDVQEGLLSAVIDLEAADSVRPSVSNAAGVIVTGSKVMRSNPAPIPAPTPDPVLDEKKKMKASLREAEKKLVLFNLDLGKVPVMNTDTLAKNVAIDLGRRVKDGKHDYHIGDAEEVIDDILSCSSLDFMGTSTRKFFNGKNTSDPRNNTMCTMPVKMDFADREVRFQAELSLRKICKVNCSVPYPKNVRTLIDSLIKDGKKSYPDSFIRTRVDIDNLRIDAFASVNKKWVDVGISRYIFPSGAAAGSGTGTGAGPGSDAGECEVTVMETGESQPVS
jgi:hypothetical protein